MIKNISKVITQHFINKNIISENQKEMCEYSIHTRLMKMIFISSIFSLAIMREVVLETAVFLLVSLSLRRRTGGYHSKSEIACFIWSILFNFISVELIAVFFSKIHIFYNLTIYLISILILMKFAPINHPNMDMGEKEIKYHKKKMQFQIYVISFIIVILELFKQSSIISLVITGVMLVSISVIISKIIKQEVQSDEQIRRISARTNTQSSQQSY